MSNYTLYEAGITINNNFYFVFQGNLYNLQRGTTGTLWTTKVNIGSPPSETLKDYDAISQLNNRFVLTVSSAGNLWEYDTINNSWSSLDKPSNTVNCITCSNAIMYGNSVFVIGSNGNLFQCIKSSSIIWINHGSPSGATFNQYTVPVTLYDGKLFIISEKYRLYERFKNGEIWQWVSHGKPRHFGPFNTRCYTVGAPMLGTKVFVNNLNGNINERIWTGSNWVWNNHGKYHVNNGYSSIPHRLNDGNFFTSSLGVDQGLWERWWDSISNSWIWANHGNPSFIGGASYVISSGPGGSIDNPARVFVMAKASNNNSQFFMFSRYWDGSNWEWFNHGQM